MLEYLLAFTNVSLRADWKPLVTSSCVFTREHFAPFLNVMFAKLNIRLATKKRLGVEVEQRMGRSLDFRRARTGFQLKAACIYGF